MGTYTYTMRAESKKVGDLTIHLAGYAGKPFWGHGGERINNAIDRKIGTARALFERRGYRPTHFVTEFADNADVYANLPAGVSFYDDYLGDESRFPVVGRLQKTRDGWDILPAKMDTELEYCVRFCGRAKRPTVVIDLGADAVGCRYGLREAHLLQGDETVVYPVK